MMRPVLSREEYLRLRGSEWQKSVLKAVREGKEAQKRKLVQMNYSCLPNEDGSLRGSKTMSTTVGMDIDWTPAPLPLEGVEQTAARKEEWLKKVPELVLSKKDELGLLMLERSATKGYHLVFRRRPELSQEENLKWASELLGVDFDKGAKDITRVFFTTSASEEDLIYLDDEIFGPSPRSPKGESYNAAETSTLGESQNAAETSPLGESHKAAETSPLGESHKAAETKQAPAPPKTLPLEGESERVSSFSFKGIPYSEIIQAYWRKNGGEPQEGERNVKLYQLAVNLRAICDNRKDVLMQVMPRLGLDEQEFRSIIDSACREVPKGISRAIREILDEKMKSEIVGETSDDDRDLEVLSEGWNPPPLPQRLPRLMQLLVKPFPEQYHPVLVVTACVVLGTIASHFRSTYLDGRIIAANLYAAIIAGSGKGKSWVPMLMKLMCRHTLQEWDEQEWKKVRENQALRDRKANAKDKPAKYHPKFRIMETMSKTSLLEVQTNLGENGMMLCNYTESDELANATRAQFSNLSVLLRKAWDLDTHRQFYMSEASCNTQCSLNAAILLTGTPKSILSRLFADTESGMMQRFVPMLLPKLKRTFRPPKFVPLPEDEASERDGLLASLWQKDLSLEDSTQMLEMPRTQKMIQQWYDDLEERYNDGLLTEAEADLSHRVGQFMQRAAIPFVALYGEEQKDIIDLVRWLGDFAYYNVCHIFATRVSRDMKESQEMLRPCTDARITAEPLLSLMPEIFTVQQFKEERIRQGQSGEVKMILSRYCRKGKIERMEKGVYRNFKVT